MDHDLIIVYQRYPPSTGLEQVSDPPQLIQLVVDLRDVFQINLEIQSG